MTSINYLGNGSCILFLLIARLFSTVTAQGYRSDSEQCRTPNREAGHCIVIHDCPPLLRILGQNPLSNEHQDFLRRSQCGFQGVDPLVCCPDNRTNGGGANPTTTINPTINLVSKSDVLPQYCGEDLTQRIVGGEKTDLYEFPWMTLLEYTKPNGRTTACGGALISRRYVLTAAHCLVGKDLPKSWNLVNVRLGEYDTSTARDCLPDSETSVYCAEDPVTISIEEKIHHEGYKPESREQLHDIALLRLSRDVVFTSYIRPICLPTNSSATEKFVQVAGWGKTESKSESTVKLKLKMPVIDNAECNRVYNTANIQLSSTQLCAGGQSGKDSCRGDSGGPLMIVKQTPEGKVQWTAVGVVSFGPTPCGMQNWPGVYTRVVDYVPWILNKMKP